MLYTLGIVTRNRPTLLADCLKSIFQQYVLPKEIIIIDQSSDGNSQSIVRLLAIKYPKICFSYKRVKQQTLAASRNTIVNSATTKFLLFTDDDCIVDRNWAKEAINALESGYHFVQGKTEQNKTKRNLISDVEFKMVERFFQAFRYVSHKNMFSYLLDPKNCGIDRMIFLRMKLRFNIRRKWFEDVDMSMQLYSKKLSVYYQPHMKVSHLFRTNLIEALILQFKMGAGFKELHASWIKYPRIITLHQDVMLRYRNSRPNIHFFEKVLSIVFNFVRWTGYRFGTIGASQ